MPHFDVTRPHIARIYYAELADPGVVPLQEWRPTSELEFNSLPTAMWGGVGRK